MFATSISLAPPLAGRQTRPPRARKPTPQGFARGTLLRTITGPRAVEQVMAGDLLLDADGQIVELRSLVTRRANAQELVEIAPSALGLGLAPGCLDRVLVIGAAQKLGLHDWRTELLYGKPALTTAQALVDGLHVQPCTQDAMIYQLGFDRDCLIVANGLKALVRASGAQTA